MYLYVYILLFSVFSWPVIRFLGVGDCKKAYFIINYSLLFLVSALRTENVGGDTLTYTQAFSSLKEITIDGYYTNGLEFGYIILEYFLGIFSNDGQFLIIGTSFIVIYGIGVFFYKCSDNLWMPTMLYIGLNLFVDMMTPIRQSISAIFILWGVYFLAKGEKIKYLLFNVLAFSFHFSALAFLPFAFLKKSKNIIVFLVGIHLTAFLLINVLSDQLLFLLIADKYSSYANQVHSLGFGIFRAPVIFIVSFFTVFLVWKKCFKNELPSTIAYISAAISMCGAIMLLMGYKMPIFSRLSYTYMLFFCLIPNVFIDKLSPLFKAIVIPIITVVITGYLIFSLINSAPYNNYESII